MFFIKGLELVWRCISEKAEHTLGGIRTPDLLCSFMTDKTLRYSVSVDLDLEPGPRSFVYSGSIPHTEILSTLTTQIEIKSISMLTLKPGDCGPHPKTKTISARKQNPSQCRSIHSNHVDSARTRKRSQI